MTEPPMRRIAHSSVAFRQGGLLALFGILLWAVAATAQTVPARGGLHEDFGRLVIDFTGATATDISGEGRHLELKFDRPAKVDIAEAASTLKDYIAKARLAADGRSLSLDFNAPVTWQAFNDGPKLALDFAFAADSTQREFDHGPDAARSRIRTAGTGKPEVTPEAPRAVVKLRTGEHEGYSRLAFDWPKDVTYQLQQTGDQAELRFSSPGTIDLAPIAGDLPPRIDSMSTAPGAGGVTVKIALKPGMVLRDFRSGRTVVLDVYDATAANLPASPNPEIELPAPPKIASAEPEPALPGPQSSGPQPEIEQAAKTPGAAAPATELEPELQSALPEAPAPKPTVGAGVSGPGVAVPVTAKPPTTFEPPRVAPPAVKVNVSALKFEGGATLYFDWPKRVALAVFRKDDALWLVFDRPAKADLKVLAPLQATIGKVEPVPSSFAFALRLTGGASASATTMPEGARWKVILKPGQAIAPTAPLQQRRETLADGGTSLFVQAIASGAAVDLRDPVDNGRLVVTPGELSGHGVARESDWPDFKLLPSYQGVVVALLNDRPKVAASPNGVVVTTPPQPVAEAAPPQAEAQTPAKAPAEAPGTNPPKPAEIAPGSVPPTPVISSKPKPLTVASGLFDMKKWRRNGPADKEDLESRLRNAGPNDKPRALLDFAEFLLANGYFPEAAGRIDELRKLDRSAVGNPLIMAVGAAAKTMHGDYAEASQMLAAPALQGVPESDLMTAYIAAKRGDAATAAKLFSQPLPDISDYPKPFRSDVRKVAARALLDTGDPLTAQNYIDPLKNDEPDAEAEAWATYLDGLRQLKIGQPEAALATWEKVTESPIDEIKARAQFAVVSEQLADKKIAPKDAVAKLEALRYLWRGDTFEFDLLYKLGHLYFDVAQPRKGLLTLRQAATHYPDHPLAKQAADDMTTEFRKLYLGGNADKLSPLTAVALYDEFRELTPPGPDGDRMIAALADRLVKVDLLDRAGDLLERQVKTRLTGDAKVAAGTRLTAIRLLDDKPDRALQALGETENPAATAPGLQAERQRLRARALFDTGETLKGLGLVENDGSLEGLWLKSDMYWKLREWPAAADALGQLIDAEQAKRAAEQKGPAPDDIAKNPASVLDKAVADAKAAAAADAPTAPDDAGTAAAAPDAKPAQKPLLDPVLAQLVLNRAVALARANDRRGMKELGRQFGKQMDTTAYAQPFKILTSPDSGVADSITAQSNSVNQLGAFVDEYRKILQSDALSTSTEPSPDTGPLAPLDKPAEPSGSGAAPTAPKGNDQTAGQPPAQAPVQ